MNPAEIENCLGSMSVIVDSREQPSARAKKRYQQFGCPYSRQKIEYGDYTYNFTLPDGRLLWLPGDMIKPSVSIERKMDLGELSNCFTHDRARFKAEFERAILNNASIYLLVEDATWENLINGRYQTQFRPKAFLASMTAWMARYNIRPIFCKSETSGILIREILYRELKERLEGGVYG